MKLRKLLLLTEAWNIENDNDLDINLDMVLNDVTVLELTGICKHLPSAYFDSVRSLGLLLRRKERIENGQTIEGIELVDEFKAKE